MRKRKQKKLKQKPKLRSIKSLESAVWKECKRIIRGMYDSKCVSCGDEVFGKRAHTGHYFRKKFIPLRCKYILDNLRIQCPYCNMRLHGNLENYTVYLLKEQQFNIIRFRELVQYEKAQKYTVQQDREYLESLLTEYKSMLYL